jgi:ATP-dependent exoDNAse (exonuclease V) beta subunit
LCRTSPETPALAASVSAGSVSPPDDFGAPLVAVERPRLSTADRVAGMDTVDVAGAGPASERLLGILVHRLFEHGDPHAELPGAIEQCRRLLRAEERIVLDDEERLLSRAAGVWMSARTRDDVAAALAGTARVFELPFSAAPDGGPIVRGTIDCVVRKPDGSILVVEFKTGRVRPIHQRQLDLYVAAVRQLRPEAPSVVGALLYL